MEADQSITTNEKLATYQVTKQHSNILLSPYYSFFVVVVVVVLEIELLGMPPLNYTPAAAAIVLFLLFFGVRV